MEDNIDTTPTNSKPAEKNESPSLEYQYATSTTLHGIGRVADAPGFWRKLPWVLVLFIAGGIYLYVTIDRIRDYLKFEANTNVNITFDDSLEFPAVTVCNYNRYMQSKISINDRQYVKHLLQVNAEFDDYSQPNDDFFPPSFFGDEFNYTAFAISTGFSLTESLLECTWKSETNLCNASAFTPYYSPTYGQCYTFNLGKLQQRRMQTQQGISSGLRILLDIRQHDYTETYASGNYEAGVKFAVHHPDELPLLDSMALSAPPGYHTYASLRMIRHKNLPKPWGVCGTDGYQDPVTYTRNTCLIRCRRDAIIAWCECLPLGYYGEYYIEGEGRIPYCDLDQFACVRGALERYRLLPASREHCFCPVSCSYTTYETTLSMAAYPSESVSAAALENFNTKIPGNKSETFPALDEEYARRNLVYLEVYFNELNIITYRQVQATPLTALLGDLGGQLGLFLGASVITGVELIEYIIRRLKTIAVKLKDRRQVDSTGVE